MPIHIRRANLEYDRQALIDMFRRHLTPRSDEQRFEWLYRNYSQGVARAWVACNDSNGEIAGAAAAFPRKMYFCGIERIGSVLGDFCMDEKYRSLGPALQLQRACLEGALESPSEFCYDFPSQNMMAIYRRLGAQQTQTLVRWAKPLRVERKLAGRIRSKLLAGGLALVANAVLARRGWKGKKSTCTVTLHQGPCGEEFNTLDRELRATPGVRAVRSAEFLNWRFLSHPGTVHEILTARRRGTLTGYIVFTRDVEDAAITDLCSVEEPAVIARLLWGAVERLRQCGAVTVSLNAGDMHPWNRLFERAGFRRRDSSPIVVYTRPGAAVSGADFQQNWYVMRGDRDS
jgi:hypothetical protein